MKLEPIPKPRFKAKFKGLALSHDGKGVSPFPGKNRIRWAMIDITQLKYPCYYEGKPSCQALEILHQLAHKRFFFLQFDRKGVFSVLDVREGRLEERLTLSVSHIEAHYRQGKTFTEYFAQFTRKKREKGEKTAWSTPTKKEGFMYWR